MTEVKILVVDDTPFTVKLLADLSPPGAITRLRSGGVGGAREDRAHRFRLLDVMVPGMGGYDLSYAKTCPAAEQLIFRL